MKLIINSNENNIKDNIEMSKNEEILGKDEIKNNKENKKEDK